MNGAGGDDELRAVLAAAAAMAAPPHLAERILSLIRPSVALWPAGEPVATEPGSTAAPDLPVVGVYGGLPALPADVPWPDHAGRPMALLAQLDCAALVALLPQGALAVPAAGRLLFFHEEEFTAAELALDGGLDHGCRVLHVPAAAAPRPAPPAVPVIPPLPLVGAAAVSVPDYAEVLDEAMGADTLTLLDLIAELRALVPPVRHRLLGWCDCDAVRPAGHRPLLQLEAEPGTRWGEVANVAFWLPDADLAAGRLDRAVRSIELT